MTRYDSSKDNVNSQPRSHVKTIYTRYTQPVYMNAISASKGFGAIAMPIFLFVRIVMGERFLQSFFISFSAGGAGFIILWYFLIRLLLLNSFLPLKYKPMEQHLPLLAVGVCAWSGAWIFVIKCLDVFVDSFYVVSNKFIQIAIDIYLGRFFSVVEAGTSNDISVNLGLAIFVIAVEVAVALTVCCTGGVSIKKVPKMVATAPTIATPKVSSAKYKKVSYAEEAKKVEALEAERISKTTEKPYSSPKKNGPSPAKKTASDPISPKYAKKTVKLEEVKRPRR